MLAALTAPDGPGGMEVVRKLMELGNIHNRSKQVERGQHNKGNTGKDQSINACVVGPPPPSDWSDGSALGGAARAGGDGPPAAELRGGR